MTDNSQPIRTDQVQFVVRSRTWDMWPLNTHTVGGTGAHVHLVLDPALRGWPDHTDTALLLREAIRHLSAVTPALRNEIDLRYGTLTDQPRLQRKIESDLAPVIEAELFIASVEHLTHATTLTPEPK